MARGPETRSTHIVLPAHTNSHGTLFGGQAVAWMDLAAGICAMRWSQMPVVTVHSDAIDFPHPIPSGAIVEIIAFIVKTGRSSMTVEVEMWAQPLKEENYMGSRGCFVMVALDEQGKPTPVPRLEPGADS